MTGSAGITEVESPTNSNCGGRREDGWQTMSAPVFRHLGTGKLDASRRVSEVDRDVPARALVPTRVSRVRNRNLSAGGAPSFYSDVKLADNLLDRSKMCLSRTAAQIRGYGR